MTATQQARQIGEAEGNKAVARAERANEGWADDAATMLRFWLRLPRTRLRAANGLGFTGEEFRTWAVSHNLAVPPDNRAFGPVIAKAIRDGVIVGVGYAPTVSSRGSARRTYRAA
jgi:hypothetical protein